MNELETKLIGWKPRQPSRALERELFGPSEPYGNWLAQWLAPAMACALAIGMFVSGEALRSTLPSAPRNLNLLALTNETLGLFNVNSDTVQWNVCLTARIQVNRPEKIPAVFKPVFEASTNRSIL